MGGLLGARLYLYYLFLQQPYELNPFISTIFLLREPTNLPEVTQLVSGGDGSQSQAIWWQRLSLSTSLHWPTAVAVGKQGVARLLGNVCVYRCRWTVGYVCDKVSGSGKSKL